MLALITGASRGIGRAIALSLASNNYNLVLCARSVNDLEALRDELKRIHPRGHFYLIHADCAEPAGLKTIADITTRENLEVDVLVNNAGLYLPGGFLNEDENALEQQMQLNVYAPHFLCKHFGKQMAGRGRGHIFNICSIASVRPVATASSYTVTKFALLGLTNVLRLELADKGVHVTAVLPGSTLTSSWEGTDIDPARFVKPEDVAKAILACLQMSDSANVDELLIRPLPGDIN